MKISTAELTRLRDRAKHQAKDLCERAWIAPEDVLALIEEIEKARARLMLIPKKAPNHRRP